MRKLLQLLLLTLLMPLASLAQVTANVQGWCEVGATPVVTSGLTSTTLVQGSYPQCTVTVFVHGGGLATLFSDEFGTVSANPFQASSTGRWKFYGALRYDITLSGAGFPSPVTFSDVTANGSSGVVTPTMDTIGQGAFFIKDPVVRGPMPTIYNGDFEAIVLGTSSVPPSVISASNPLPGWDPNPNMTLFYETVTPYEGAVSLKTVSNNLQPGASVTSVTTLFPVTPGETYFIQGAAKTDGVVSANIAIRFLCKDGSANCFAPYPAGSIVAITNSTSWTVISATGVVPALAVTGFIDLITTPIGTAGTAWYDAINLYRVSYPTGLILPSLTSASANPATTGTVRLASGDSVLWRDQANTTNLGLSKLTAAFGNIPVDTFNFGAGNPQGLYAAFFADASPTTAVSGAYRLSSVASINWRNNTNSADVVFGKTGAASGTVPADTFVGVGTGFLGNFFGSGSSSEAAAGLIRLQSAETINWRNNAGNADVPLSKNSSDNLVWPNGFSAATFSATTYVTSPAFISSAANPSVTGVIRLANQDQIKARNSANNADALLIWLDSQNFVNLGDATFQPLIPSTFLNFAAAGTITSIGPIGSGNGNAITLLATNGVGGGSHTGGNIGLTPGAGNNGGASGVITLGAGTTVALLPTAATFPGAIMYVTDSTAVAAEGQTCVGSSTNKALAFSNGTVWKCF